MEKLHGESGMKTDMATRVQWPDCREYKKPASISVDVHILLVNKIPLGQ